jgi:hypothetical protein
MELQDSISNPGYRRFYIYTISSTCAYDSDWLHEERPNEITNWTTHTKIRQAK